MRRRRWISFCLCLAACRAEAPPAPVADHPRAEAGRNAPAASSRPLVPPEERMRSFDEDVDFLVKHGATIKVLTSEGGGRIAISGTYQARVMTSAVEARGTSLGFVNRDFIASQKTGTAFDNYGGEDRFWLGPEGGQYALYFAPGAAFEFGNWQTPAAFQEGEWPELGSDPSSATFEQRMSLVNYARNKLELEVKRKITLLGPAEAGTALGLPIPQGVKWVGFKTDNTLTNRGPTLTESAGLPSIWILGMFNPAPGTRIIAPFETQGSGPVVNDRYFGKVPPARLLIDHVKGFVLFKADGQSRGKIGLSPERAKPVLGSYSAQGKLLTVVRFTRPAGARRYVNNLWEIAKDPYAGDVSNAYNDGPVEPGKPSLGGFYELESSSPAAALTSDASLTHTHETYHFTGPESALSAIAERALGVSLADVERAKL